MKTRITTLKTGTITGSESQVDEQIMKVGLGVIGASSCVIGLWAAVCLASGMIASGGPLNLISNWITAVVG